MDTNDKTPDGGKPLAEVVEKRFSFAGPDPRMAELRALTLRVLLEHDAANDAANDAASDAANHAANDGTPAEG